MRALALMLASSLVAACGPSATTGQCNADLLPGDLVITEVFADSKAPPGGSGTDEGKEWFEIYNNTARPLELEGVTVTHARPDGSKAKTHKMDAVTIAPGTYFTLGNAAQDLVPAYIDYGYAADLGDMFNTDGGKLTLGCGGTEVDSAVYDTVKEGHSRQLTSAQPPDYTLNDDGANWCQGDLTEFDTGNFGTPGADSDCTPIVVGQCSDGGTMRAAVPPIAGDLVITEVMPNPAATGDTDGEWFEIKAINGFDLNGVALDRAGDTSNPQVINSAECVHVNAGEYALFAHTADMALNGGLPAGSVKATFTFALVDGTSAAPGDVRVMSGDNVIDAITWTSTRSGKSHALDPNKATPEDNDIETNFCDGAAVYGAGDFGTPLAANAACPVTTPAGMCLDNATLRPIVKPGAGALVITEMMPNPAGTDGPSEWFEIKNTSTTAFDLNDLVVGRTGTTSTSVLKPAGCKSIAPGAFGLIAHSNDPAVNGGLPEVDALFSTTISLLQTNGDIQVLDGTTLLDAASWTSSVDSASRELSTAKTNTTDNDVPANYCTGTASYPDAAGLNKGTPKAVNTCP